MPNIFEQAIGTVGDWLQKYPLAIQTKGGMGFGYDPTFEARAKAAQQSAAMEALKPRMELMGKYYDLAKPGEGFSAEKYFPELFPEGTFLKRKPPTPWMGIIGQTGGTSPAPAETYAEGTPGTTNSGKAATWKGGRWVYNDTGEPVPPSDYENR